MNEHDTKHSDTNLKQQTEQARRVLMRLQWLVIILLTGGLIWLYNAFESVVTRVDTKLTKIDTVDTRLNNIDDRLFALTPAETSHQANQPNSHQEKELFYIELTLANQLFRQGNFEDTLTALQAIQWQLTHRSALAAPIKATLQESLKQDIAYVNALKNQPDAWQSHTIKMQEVQTFLRKQQSNNTGALSRNDILLHDATMLLSLAVGSANARDRNQMTAYLQEVKTQLQTYIELNGSQLESTKTKTDPDNLSGSPAVNQTLTSPADALYQINELLANTPRNKGLQSTQILQNQHN